MLPHNKQSNNKQPLQVFLCHSSRDKNNVRKLYNKLRAEGIKPWFDEEDLLPGQRWPEEISKAVSSADAVLICISRNSVDRAGYVQKEIKQALDVADQQPEGSIFVIPVRLEKCNIPERLRNLHCVDLFEERGYKKLIQALQYRANELKRVIKPVPQPIDKDNPPPRFNCTMRIALLALSLLLLLAGITFATQEWPFQGEAGVATIPTATATGHPTTRPASIPGYTTIPVATATATFAPQPTTTLIPWPTATSSPTTTATPTLTATPLPTWVPAMVEIPAGPFLMGSSDEDPLAYDDEKPQHTVELPTYWIGTTEVTNAQFRPFVEGDGYNNPDYWTEAGWEWRTAEDITQPQFWDYTEWNGNEQPVIGISWYEAVAYARWLSTQTGHDFRLPTEAEWEKAARGREGLIWPWGNEWVADNCNCTGTVGNTTPVGSYPDGASPYGVLDMAGNAWEWTAMAWPDPYPYAVEDAWSADYLEEDYWRVRRGGAWNLNQEFVRTAYRSPVEPRTRDQPSNGLRLASDDSPPGNAE
jgi:formylglycine-generating enzyme required for sulfatase activity